MAEPQEISTLRRRGRRRLVGAIALVLLAVIVLPMVFDSEPRQSAPPVSVRIPSEEDADFSPKVTPKGPKPEASAEEKRAPKAPEKTPAAEAERARAETAIAGEQFVIPVAALASPEKVKELAARLAEAKLPYYTEPVATAQGPVTRVRVGPFGDRAAAEKAVEQLKLLGLKPGNVTGKS